MVRHTGHSISSSAKRVWRFSFLLLLLPAAGTLSSSNLIGGYDVFLWLLGLTPVFLGGYLRGWHGAAKSIAVVIATLAVAQLASSGLGHPTPSGLPGVVAVLFLSSTGAGWLTEALHRDRDIVADMALTDILTRLPNRRHAEIFLENEFAAAQRGRTLTIVLFDLDHFKSFNDQYGHGAGDLALKKFAGILAQTTRRMNLSARFGGEEFLSILAGSETPGAMIFADRVRLALKSSGLSDDPLTVSAGVASFERGMKSKDELLAVADRALYQAKREGRDRACLFERDEPAEDRSAEPVSQLPTEISPPRAGDTRGATSSREAESSMESTLSNRTEASLQGFDGGTVLVVEDDRALRSLIVTYLKRQNYQPTECGDFHSALDEIRTEYDIVLTDIRLPDAPGTKLVSAVKSHWPMTQVIVVTGLRDAETAARALNAGADRYLLKPFGMPELEEHLGDAMERRARLLKEQEDVLTLSSEAAERAKQAHEAVLSGLRALALAVEVRDPYIRGHSQRVSAYARQTAEVLDPTGTVLPRDSLGLACELHDVGKIGISDLILNKGSHLTAEEFEEIKAHPETGRRLLEGLVEDRIILAVANYHHEWWNGHGYPTGLAGDNIPLSARLVAVVDTLDAMTTDRAYRSALPWARAVDQIVELRGVQFDPVVIDAFIEALPSLRNYYDKVDLTAFSPI